MDVPVQLTTTYLIKRDGIIKYTHYLGPDPHFILNMEKCGYRRCNYLMWLMSTWFMELKCWWLKKDKNRTVIQGAGSEVFISELF